MKPHGLLTENGGELRPLPTAPSQTGLTLVDLPEPDDSASSSADSRHLSDYFKGIDKNIQDAVQVEVQLNAEYGLEAPERPLPQSGKQEHSTGADCGIQWWNAVFIMLLIGIVLPVFYIIYFKTQGLVAHTSNTTLTSNSSTDGLEGKLPHSSMAEKKSWGGETAKPSPCHRHWAHAPVTDWRALGVTVQMMFIFLSSRCNPELAWKWGGVIFLMENIRMLCCFSSSWGSWLSIHEHRREVFCSNLFILVALGIC